MRRKADMRSVVFLIIIMMTFASLWNYGHYLWSYERVLFFLLYGLHLLLSITISVIVHNHTHLRIWKSAFLNKGTDLLLTIFYGFPVFVWFPTHHANHHVHVNKVEDQTRTYMKTERNNLWSLLTYPTISGSYQQPLIFNYVKKIYTSDKKQFSYCMIQIVFLLTWIISFALLDWKKALVYVLLPQQVSLNTVLVFNYLQHVHADEESALNSSRNFTHPLTNFIVFNNGFHTIHHLKPALHWSELPAKHKLIQKDIDPRLNEKTIWGFIIRVYLVSIFYKPYRTSSMRLERMNKKSL